MREHDAALHSLHDGVTYMHAAQKFVAAILTVGLFMSSMSVSLADKGGNGKDKGKGTSSAPGQSSNNGNGNGNGGARQGPGIQGPTKTPGQSSSEHGNGNGSSSKSSSGARSGGLFDETSTEFQGDVDTINGGQVTIKTSNREQTLAATAPVISALDQLKGKGTLVFFTTGGNEITAVAALGQFVTMKVTGRKGTTFMLQGNDGQSRLIMLDAKTINKLHVKVGSNLGLVAKSASSGKVVALDMGKGKGAKSKAEDFASKFNRNNRDTDVAESNGRCGPSHSRNGNPAFANQMAKDAANDASGHNPPGLPHECVNPAGHTRGFCKSESTAGICASGGVSGGESSESEVANAHAKAKARHANKNNSEEELAAAGNCVHGKSRNGNPAFANQMAKDAANDASGHNPPGLPHECVNPAGHTRGFCKSSSSTGICGSGGVNGGEVASANSNGCPPGTESSRRGNPAFANQMAKDEANDISGHNPPGLPHECVNPAGHTRGFCKSHSTASGGLCSAAGVAGGSNSGIVATTPGATGGTGTRSVSRSRELSSGERGPGTLGAVGGLPVGFNTQFPAGAAGAPTHVLGAAVGPRGARRTRVLPVAIQPVGKRRCVWYKTAVLAASTGPVRIIGTSAISGKPKLHKKCR